MATKISKKELKTIPLTAYAAIRSELKTGDLIFCSGEYIFSYIIEGLTRSAWSHVAIIYKDEALDRILVLEAEPFIGVRMIPLSTYLTDYKGRSKPYEGQIVLSKFATPLSMEDINQGISFGLDELTRPYDMLELVRIIIRMAFKISRRADNRSYMCSEFVREVLVRGNVDMPYQDTYISPDGIWMDERVKLTHRIL